MNHLLVSGFVFRVSGFRCQNPVILLCTAHRVSKIFVIVMLAVLITCPPGWSQTMQKKGLTLEKRVADLESEVTWLKRETNVYSLDGLPETLILCDKKIPIFSENIRERFEREFFQILEDRGLLTIIIKRYFKYLNMINTETQNMSLPSDLIYLVITESYLNPRTTSRANATGLWQFMKETGKNEGLYIDDYVDERYNIKKATRSALAHLKKLNGEFGDWLIAMAAYNAGPGRLREAIENQNTKNFFEMFLPQETERYIFRIMAFKEIVLNREAYGIKINEKDLYKPIVIDEVLIETGKEIHESILSKCMDVSFKIFRDNNLHLKKYRLPRGLYSINVPHEKREIFLQRLGEYPYINVIREK
jgi:membrane-bound lytic murein transglycosylase D